VQEYLFREDGTIACSCQMARLLHLQCSQINFKSYIIKMNKSLRSLHFFVFVVRRWFPFGDVSRCCAHPDDGRCDIEHFRDTSSL
jgi:hypothetical protein